VEEGGVAQQGPRLKPGATKIAREGTMYRAPTQAVGGLYIDSQRRKMPGFPTETVGTLTNRGKARRYKNRRGGRDVSCP
jgi:hypothetical protein